MCPGSAGVRGGEPAGAGERGSARPHAAARAAEPGGDAGGARAAGAHGHQGPRLHGAAPAPGQPPPRQPRLRPLQPRLQVLLPGRGPLQVSAALYRKGSFIVPQIDPSVPQPVVQSRRRPLLGPSPG